MIQLLKSYKNIFWFFTFGYFFVLMINITLKYIPFNINTAFLQIKQTEVTQIPSYIFFFYLHVYTAIFALIAGFTQFSQIILKKYSKIHKYTGRIYVFVVLFLASPSGLFIGFYANGGVYSQLSFVVLATLWFYFTLKGFLYIKNKKIQLHKTFMLRSFALTFSAITLRLWKVILVYLFHPSPIDVYQIIAWLGWIPNLIFIEYYIYKKNKI